MGLAKVQVVTFDDIPEESEPEVEVRARPEELRLLEAMLFASAEPLAERELAERLPMASWKGLITNYLGWPGALTSARGRLDLAFWRGCW